MKQTARLALLCGAAAVSVCAFGDAGAESVGYGRRMQGELMRDTGGQIATVAGVASSFREAAMEDPAAAVEYFFSADLARRWKAAVASEMIVQQLTDFFTGAMSMSGPVDASGGFVGLYNPWWDGVLVLRLHSHETVTTETAPLRVEDFAFLSGETFRGERAGAEVACLTVVPEGDPLSVEIWRATAATRRVFMEKFPLEGEFAKSNRAFAAMRLKVKRETEMERLQTRSALRLQHTMSLVKNARDVGFATVLTRLARKGTLYQLYSHFREPNSRPLLRTFAELPEAFRTDFTPYCYVPTERATLYVLVNKKMPRLFVTVTLMPTPTAESSSMEWYDLIQADELLSAWNNRKEVAK